MNLYGKGNRNVVYKDQSGPVHVLSKAVGQAEVEREKSSVMLKVVLLKRVHGSGLIVYCLVQ